jgi:rhamnosyltransferase
MPASGSPGSIAPDRAVEVLVPILRGGVLLRSVARAVLAQASTAPVHLLLVDSGSLAGELDALRALGARIEPVDPAEFDHGTTRDFAAARAVAAWGADVLVFLNQDALPVDDRWLERLIAPFSAPDPPAAVQGGIREFPPELLPEVGRRRFFWDSCGPRFYFTRESEGWIERHGGIGFSTVNCAIARWAWEAQPFGPAPILEDKLWQKRAAERGWRIDSVPEAAVWHTHDYDLRTLGRRCLSEGFGWRLVGERYRLGTALGDLARGADWREWWRGLRTREMRRPTEVLFPLVRPLALWWGNRWARRVRL